MVRLNVGVIDRHNIHPEWTVQTIEADYDGVYDITKVDEKDFGGEMAHWEVGGV